MLIGIKSTALLFGERTRPMLAVFYAAAVVLIGAAGLMAGGGLIFVARACRLRRASGLAGRAHRHRRSGALPDAVQVEPRRRADPVRARCCSTRRSSRRARRARSARAAARCSTCRTVASDRNRTGSPSSSTLDRLRLAGASAHRSSRRRDRPAPATRRRSACRLAESSRYRPARAWRRNARAPSRRPPRPESRSAGTAGGRWRAASGRRGCDCSAQAL